MSIVCIKIGENEPNTYAKFDVLSKHLDIIEVLPRKRDKDGNLLQRTMGVKADKHYLAIDVDMDELSDEEFENIRSMLREEWQEYTGEFEPNTEIPDKRKIAKRLRKIDLNDDKHLIAGFSTNDLITISNCANARRNKQNFDISTISKFNLKLSFKDFAKMVVNKNNGKTLEEEMGTNTKTLKAISQEFIQNKIDLYNIKVAEIKAK